MVSRQSEWARRQKQNDPVAYEARLARQRERDRKARKAAKSSRRVRRGPDVQLPVAAFREWLHAARAQHEDNYGLATRLGISEKAVRRVFDPKETTVSMSVVDAALSEDGRYMLRELYPDEAG